MRRGEGGVGFLVRECLVDKVQFVSAVKYEESVWMKVRGGRGREALYICCVQGCIQDFFMGGGHTLVRPLRGLVACSPIKVFIFYIYITLDSDQILGGGELKLEGGNPSAPPPPPPLYAILVCICLRIDLVFQL